MPARPTSTAGKYPDRRTLPLLVCLLAVAPVQGQNAASYAEVAPILQERCVMCHSGSTPPLGLGLDSLAAILKGSSKGPVVKAGDPAGSELIRRLKGSSQPRMPMTGPPFLADQEIALIERWIGGGLQAGTAAKTPPSVVEAVRPRAGEPVTYLHVAPIFARRCAKCHTDNGLMGPPPEGLRLTSYEATLAAFDRARVVPGHAEASELVRRVRGQARPRMPFDGPPWLSAEEISLIEQWVDQGARNAEGTVAPLPVGARVRLHGTLNPDSRLDGLDLVFGRRARSDKNPAPGSYVQVRGSVDETGRVIVERLRSR
jgi:uncharacterized membrane protein